MKVINANFIPPVFASYLADRDILRGSIDLFMTRESMSHFDSFCFKIFNVVVVCL